MSKSKKYKGVAHIYDWLHELADGNERDSLIARECLDMLAKDQKAIAKLVTGFSAKYPDIPLREIYD